MRSPWPLGRIMSNKPTMGRMNRDVGEKNKKSTLRLQREEVKEKTR